MKLMANTAVYVAIRHVEKNNNIQSTRVLWHQDVKPQDVGQKNHLI